MEPYSVDMLIIETANVLWKYMKKFGVISEKETMKLYDQMIKLIEDKIIIIEPGRKYLAEALKISMDYNIPVYDGLFLAQAKYQDAELITGDKKQREIAVEMNLRSKYIERKNYRFHAASQKYRI